MLNDLILDLKVISGDDIIEKFAPCRHSDCDRYERVEVDAYEEDYCDGLIFEEQETNLLNCSELMENTLLRAARKMDSHGIFASSCSETGSTAYRIKQRA